MAKTLNRDFVERKISKLPVVPRDWNIDKSQYFKLDLKMCQLRSVLYGFTWGSDNTTSDRFKTVTEMPSRVLVIDLSLNELSSLDSGTLSPLHNLRTLDASLNRITSVTGLEQLKHLQMLNLAHNALRRVDLLPSCPSLVELNLSMNELEDISGLPILGNLTVLHLSNNKLQSLDGVQSLGRLKELYVQNNQVPDLIPVCSCLHLTILNAAHNRILALQSATDVLGRLKRLRVLNLEGNPVERSADYHAAMLQSTTIVSLDNVPVRPLPKQPTMPDGEKPRLADNVLNIRDITRKVYEEHINAERSKMEENVNFLQGRILSLQNNFQEFESKLRADLDLCLMHLESLSTSQLARFDTNHVRSMLQTPEPRPWQQVSGLETKSPDQFRREDKPDYKQVKDTDELLRLAYVELSKDHA